MNPFDEKILERLDRIEAQLAPVSQSAQSIQELKEDLKPLVNQAFRLLAAKLEGVESSVQLEDILVLLKHFLKNTRNLTYTLNQLENLIDFITTLDPLLKSSVPAVINHLDDLEQRGVFRIFRTMLDIRANIASAYGAEELARIGDGLVVLLGVAQKLSDPKAAAFLKKIACLPAMTDLSKSSPRGPVGVLKASMDPDVKKGLGVMIELTKALGRVKDQPEIPSPSG